MAPRLNVEESLWSDARFQRFMIKIGDQHRATGAVVNMWRLAQKWWVQDRSLIPELDWKNAELDEELLTCGLAERRTGGIYVRGAEDHFKWWFKGIEQRRRAGKRSAEARKKNFGTAQPISNESRTTLDEIELSSSSSSSSSPSVSTSSSTSKDISPEPTLIPHSPAKISSFDFEKLYQAYPRKEGKTIGLELCARLVKTQIDFDNVLVAIHNYTAHIKANNLEPKFVKLFSSFMRSWGDWLEPNAGKVKLQNSPSPNRAQRPPQELIPHSAPDPETRAKLRELFGQVVQSITVEN